MELPVTTPALLFPAIAILMLGFINRYISTAGVIRSYRKDHDSGLTRKDMAAQLDILKKRIELSRQMITIAASALLFACLSMFLIFIEYQTVAQVVFGLSLLGMIVSIFVSLNETRLSNRSLLMEIDHLLSNK